MPAIARLVRPSAIRPSTSRSRAVRESSGPSSRERPSIWATTSGSSTGAPPAKARIDRLGKALDVADAVLEQVADPLGAAREELTEVAVLDVLAEQQDADGRKLLADRQCSAQAVVGIVGRHAGRRRSQRRACNADLAQEVLGVACLGDQGVARVDEESRGALTQEDGVVGNHDSHGISAGGTVPPPGGLHHVQLAVVGRDPIGQPA